MKICEEDLENVVGGTDNLDYMEHLTFKNLSTEKEAIEYLRSHGFFPSDHRYREYMEIWKAAHGQ